MKRIIYILFCLSIAGCNYLEDYSQDLVIAKSVQDVDELLLGSGYLLITVRIIWRTGIPVIGYICWTMM